MPHYLNAILRFRKRMKRDCDNNGNEDEMSEGINQNRFKRESEMLVTCNTYLVIT